MDCSRIDLIAYHFATLDEGERSCVEGHLLGCKACLESYLALKRHIDAGPARGARPSSAARARLRGEVARAFRPARSHHPLAWLLRPIPLYQGLAVAAVTLFAAVTLPTLVRAGAGLNASNAGERIDTSRTTAESLSIY